MQRTEEKIRISKARFKRNFSCTESNANEKNLLFSLICIRFDT